MGAPDFQRRKLGSFGLNITVPLVSIAVNQPVAGFEIEASDFLRSRGLPALLPPELKSCGRRFQA